MKWNSYQQELGTFAFIICLAVHDASLDLTNYSSAQQLLFRYQLNKNPTCQAFGQKQVSNCRALETDFTRIFVHKVPFKKEIKILHLLISNTLQCNFSHEYSIFHTYFNTAYLINECEKIEVFAMAIAQPQNKISFNRFFS